MFIHRSALLCDECGENEVIALGMSGKEDDGDSNEWPQYSQGSESDSPDHCDNCGDLLYEVTLTDDGREAVALCLISGMHDETLACEWSDHADLPNPGVDHDWNLDAVRAWADNLGTAVEALETFEEAYMGQYDSEEDWAVQYVEDTGMLSNVGELAMYFDYKAFARDCQLGGDMTFLTCGLGVFAFSNY